MVSFFGLNFQKKMKGTNESFFWLKEEGNVWFGKRLTGRSFDILGG
jgi:hypothetical protein